MEIEQKRFNRWLVLGPAESQGSTLMADAVCDCGTRKTVNYQNIRQGKSKSCGCLRHEISQKINLSHGRTKTKTYKIWLGMKRRCTNKNERFYPEYGGRGIKVCDRWAASFEAFLQDMGECPEGHSIERLDVNGHYEASNCKWLPRALQAWNTRANKLDFATAQQIRLEVGQGVRSTVLASRYGIDRTMVNKIVRGENWKSAMAALMEASV